MLNLPNVPQVSLSGFFSLTGRAHRLELIGVLLAGGAWAAAGHLMLARPTLAGFGLVGPAIAYGPPCLLICATLVRRLHDIGYSGVWIVLFPAPFGLLKLGDFVQHHLKTWAIIAVVVVFVIPFKAAWYAAFALVYALFLGKSETSDNYFAIDAFKPHAQGLSPVNKGGRRAKEFIEDLPLAFPALGLGRPPKGSGHGEHLQPFHTAGELAVCSWPDIKQRIRRDMVLVDSLSRSWKIRSVRPLKPAGSPWSQLRGVLFGNPLLRVAQVLAKQPPMALDEVKTRVCRSIDHEYEDLRAGGEIVGDDESLGGAQAAIDELKATIMAADDLAGVIWALENP